MSLFALLGGFLVSWLLLWHKKSPKETSNIIRLHYISIILVAVDGNQCRFIVLIVLWHFFVAVCVVNHNNNRIMYVIPEDDYDHGIKHAMLHVDLGQIYNISHKNLILPYEDRQKILRKY